MQLVAERQSTDTIRAQMNYVVDTGVPLVRYIDWPEMEHKAVPPQYHARLSRAGIAPEMEHKAVPPQYEQHEVAIRNGRPLRDTFRLDTHADARVPE